MSFRPDDVRTRIEQALIDRGFVHMRELARHVEIDESTLSRMCSGKMKRPSWETAVALSRALHVPMRELGYPFPEGVTW